MLLHECWYKTKNYSSINWAHIVFWVYLDYFINLYVITLMKTLKWSYSSDFSAALPRTKKLLIFGFSNAKKWMNKQSTGKRTFKYIIIPFLAFSDPLPHVLRFLGSIVQWFVEGLTYTSTHPLFFPLPQRRYHVF